MKLSNDEVKHIASLAKVGMTEEEFEVIGAQLSQILEQFQSLSTLDTENSETTAHPTNLNTVLTNDEIINPKAGKDMLNNVPKKEHGFVRVRSVIE